jgi:DNA/RNA endonuclease G (NUC1)
MKLEKSVEDSIKKRKKNAVVITGVIYGNIKKQYLNNSRIKVPILYYKILVFGKKDYICWIGDNFSSKVITTNLHTILITALKNKNKLNITF